MQIIPLDEGENYKWDVYDATKIIPTSDYPEIEVGTLTLNKNPTNFFSEVEETAFAPANFVPGIEASKDRLLQGRLFIYGET